MERIKQNSVGTITMQQTQKNSLRHSPLHKLHLEESARMVEFAGWKMPISYSAGSIAEVNSVRTSCGMFDVSHMCRFEFTGQEVRRLLDRLFGARVASISVGTAKYSVMCNEKGGIIDDVIVYALDDEKFIIVCNASRKEVDYTWIKSHSADLNLTFNDISDLTAMIAVQGPKAISTMSNLIGQDIAQKITKRFTLSEFNMLGTKLLVVRTGYTGEDGIEIIVTVDIAKQIWNMLVDVGVQPCGLAARDVLRLEAGLVLYGNDIDEETTPYEAKLGWTIKLQEGSEYIAQLALQAKQRNISKQLTPFAIREERKIARSGMSVFASEIKEKPIGRVTSAGFSPTLDYSIGLSYTIPNSVQNRRVYIDIRGKLIAAEVLELPFYKK